MGHGDNLYCGRAHPVLGDNGFGNPFKADIYGRKKCVELYRQFTLPNLTECDRTLLRSKRQLACWCAMDELCHVSELINSL